jgi:two-component system cell cycle sensor histidine kinase/response regulator CckA
MTKLVLEQNGYKVLVASNGQEGLTLAERYHGPINLLMTDLVMPQMCGRQLAERISISRPETKVLFMSGYTEDVIVHQGVDSATTDFLHKPFKLNELTKKVREVLDRHKT